MAKIEDVFFVEDSSFKKMMNIINEYKNNPPLSIATEKHHIIPKCFFKLKKIPIDNSENNLVELPLWEHILVHYYSINCIIPELKNAMINSTYRLINIPGKITKEMLIKNQKLILSTKNLQISKNGKKIYCYENKKTYLSIRECARELGLKDSIIAKVCKGVYVQTKGYHFCFEENKKNYIPKKRTNSLRGKATGKGRKVYCLENKKTYLSARDVCYQFGWDVKKYNSSIYQCCKGKMKQCKGYHFVWEDEYASWKTATTARIKRV